MSEPSSAIASNLFDSVNVSSCLAAALITSSLSSPGIGSLTPPIGGVYITIINDYYYYTQYTVPSNASTDGICPKSTNNSLRGSL